MDTLRKSLKDAEPKLYQALKRSWEIAEDEWLPALPPNEDSFNSYPHLRNIENHLNRIIRSLELQTKENGFHITPVEIYVLLSAILFHDIGRLLKKDPKDPTTHGQYSQAILEKFGGELGICSYELMRSIARICVFHNSPDRLPVLQEKTLGDITIDPYGRIREKMIASLLMLIDCMDFSCIRVIPSYIQSMEKMAVVGAFRKVVRGVDYDPIGQLTSISLAMEERETADKKPDAFTTDNYQYLNICIKEPDRAGKMIEDWRLTGFSKSVDQLTLEQIQILSQKPPEPEKAGLYPPLVHAVMGKTFCYLEGLLSKCRTNIQRTETDKPWPRGIILALVMQDIRQNNLALQRVGDALLAHGIPLRAWMMEFKGRLYDEFGLETYEPLFTGDFLREVVGAMHDLSTHVFGSGYFTYDQLASALRESNVNRVRLAVRRISILTCDPAPCGTIWVGDQQWRWEVPPGKQDVGKELDDKIKKLDDIDRRIADVRKEKP